jgi:hypothetical protein
MKPINNKIVLEAYYRFSLYLSLTVLLAVMSFGFFQKTSLVEIAKIQSQAAVYDNIYNKTIDLVNSMDTTYSYLQMLNSPTLDNAQLASLVSKRKVSFGKALSDMNKKDCVLYTKLNNDLITFLNVRDAIRLAIQKEAQGREQLMKCIEKSHKAN